MGNNTLGTQQLTQLKPQARSILYDPNQYNISNPAFLLRSMRHGG